MPSSFISKISIHFLLTASFTQFYDMIFFIGISFFTLVVCFYSSSLTWGLRILEWCEHNGPSDFSRALCISKLHSGAQVKTGRMMKE